jgi:hypothetical protein
MGVRSMAGGDISFGPAFIAFLLLAYRAEGLIQKSSPSAEFPAGISAGLMLNLLAFLIVRVLTQSL